MAFAIGYLLLKLLGVLISILLIIYTYFKWIYQYWERKGIPYLKPKIPFGNFQSPFERTMSAGDQVVVFYERAKAKGWKYFGLYTMVNANLMVLDLEILKHILTKDFSHFTDRGMYVNEKADPLSANLFNLAGTRWRNLRAKLTPTFTSGKMKQMFQTLVDTGLILEKYLEDNISPTDPVDIKETVARFSTDIIGSCAFGLDCNSFKDPNSPFRIHGKRAFKMTKAEILQRILCMNFPTIGKLLGFGFTVKDVGDFFTKIVEDTISYREKNGIVRKDFLQLLIELKDNDKGQHDESNGLDDGKLTMGEICAQSLLFFLAGFETSSTTMTFALFELATHPELQDRAREEIKTVLAKHDNKMTYDALNDLKYMKQIIDETLRMYPPVPMLTRECVEDYKVPGEDLVIEKGVRVVIPVRGIHYDEDYYKNPKEFNPDNFSDENRDSRSRYAHLPFGEGPRICIGERFGVMQTKVGLTSILRRFRVKLSEKTKVPLKMSTTSFIPATEGDIWLNLEKL